MTTDNQTVLTDENMRVRGDKRQRIKKVKRAYANAAERDMTDTGVLDEALEIGLTKLERKLGIAV
jgi:hypothetical protein